MKVARTFTIDVGVVMQLQKEKNQSKFVEQAIRLKIRAPPTTSRGEPDKMAAVIPRTDPVAPRRLSATALISIAWSILLLPGVKIVVVEVVTSGFQSSSM